MKRKIELFAACLIVIIATTTISAAVHVYRQNQAIHHLENQKKLIESDRAKTESDLKNTQELQQKTDTEKKQLEQKSQDQEKQIQDLNNQLQAKKAAQESLAAATLRNATFTGRASAAVVAGCGDNEYAQFIYQKESGCDLNAVNPGGCRGIGQACPGSKLPCGADYACQNAFFTDYANGRYGGWVNAYSFWLANGWW